MKTRRQFLRDGAAVSLSVSSVARLAKSLENAKSVRTPSRPNIVLILADDMGFSDIGCYGSEIKTPNLDKLAAGGLRFTQFYNNPRCCPSRASLMTGLYSHQVGFGLMASDYGRYPYPGYSGDLSQDCVTIAEALRGGGYRTAMVGKWHLTPTHGVSTHNWPLQRGFERYYGTIAGHANYFDPATLVRGNTPIRAEEGSYYTDSLGQNAVQFVEEFAHGEAPFFLYAAFTAGHWPLHALEEDVAKYSDSYRLGWDHIRSERHARQIRMGLVKRNWPLTIRDPRVPPWELASYKEWEMRRMTVYAAQIDRLDQNVGQIIAKVEELGIADNTLFLFMSDNGGNFEEIDTGAHSPSHGNFTPDSATPQTTRNGSTVRWGNLPTVLPGAEDTFQSYGIPWGNVSNTPFRLFKHYAHEGGISTPLIAYWPSVIRERNSLTSQIGHETDIMATCLEIAGLKYPATARSGNPSPALVGVSLLPIFQGRTRAERGPIFWEHHGNCAMRSGKWKLVSQFPEYWELYDMEADRTETHNLCDRYPEKTKALVKEYREWARRFGVQTWPMPETPSQEWFQGVSWPDYLREDQA